ncbi:MAG: polysaccharide biosynthesis tyrosine autokinase [Chloroflexota bacterium]|nr:MAG: hypothetical protein DIU68_07840 [Chloroflexota bacterium]
MELLTYARILWRRKWLIILTIAVTVSVAAIGTQMIEPFYAASATLRITTPPQGGPSYLDHDLLYADRLMNTYAQIAVSDPILAELTGRLGLESAPDVRAEVIVNSELLRLTVQSKDADLAANAANELANILVERSEELYANDPGLLVEVSEARIADLQAQLRDLQAERADLSEEQATQAQSLDQTMIVLEDMIRWLREQQEWARTVEALLANTISVVSEATAPDDPVQSSLMLNLILGALLGGIGGATLAFLLESMDRHIYSSQEIERVLQSRVLSVIPRTPRWQRSPWFDRNSAQIEALRRLEISLFPAQLVHDDLTQIKGIDPTFAGRLYRHGVFTFRQLASLTPDQIKSIAEIDKGELVDTQKWIEQAGQLAQRSLQPNKQHGYPQILLVTSPGPKEGKSRITANLAATIAQTGRTVIVIDADLRRPSLHKIFGVPNASGLTAVLSGQMDISNVLQDTYDQRIKVVTSGDNSANVSFSTPLLALGLEDLTQRFDQIIIDAPSLLTADAAALARMADGVLLVVRQDRAREQLLLAAAQQLEISSATLSGIVLNFSAGDRASRVFAHYRRKAFNVPRPRFDQSESSPAARPIAPAAPGFTSKGQLPEKGSSVNV